MTNWKPYDSFGGLIIVVGQCLNDLGRISLAKNGLEHISLGRFWVLHELYQRPHNQASLCKILNQKPSSMTEKLRKLESEKFVKAKVNERDPRRKEWRLDSKGKREYLKAEKVLKGIGKDIDHFFQEQGIRENDVDKTKEILKLLSVRFFERNQRRTSSAVD